MTEVLDNTENVCRVELSLNRRKVHELSDLDLLRHLEPRDYRFGEGREDG